MNEQQVNSGLQYELKLMDTAAATGYFACVPFRELTDDEGIAYIRSHPNDEFMRRFLIRRISDWSSEQMEERIRKTPDRDLFLLALLQEACLFTETFHPLLSAFGHLSLRLLADQTPLLYLKAISSPDHRRHREWSQLAERNMVHQQMPVSEEPSGPAIPYSASEMATVPEETVSLAALVESRAPSVTDAPYRAIPPAETARMALGKLEAQGLLADVEKRHVASLSPIGLLRRWRMDISVTNGRHDFRLGGLQTAYGRGFDLDSARASYAMEIVERHSAFAGVSKGALVGYRKPHALIRARYTELKGGEAEPLSPNRLLLEAPYENESIHWIPGEMQSDRGTRNVLLPVQALVLFSNLDEVKLFSGRGSTGLAAGNTMEEAKVAALLEMVERYSEGVMPFELKQCFTLEAQDEGLSGLLEDYVQRGIQVQFQDITTPMGVPCCKCFVRHLSGTIAKGTGAHLNARRAIVSALTETPFPFPSGGPSGPGYTGLIRVPFENLPDYGSGSAAEDLALLETLFIRNGFTPIYVDLTRPHLGFPVVRVIVPGMEINGDLDRFTRVHPNFIRNYLKSTGG